MKPLTSPETGPIQPKDRQASYLLILTSLVLILVELLELLEPLEPLEPRMIAPIAAQAWTSVHW